MSTQNLDFSHGVQDHWHELPDEDFGPSCRKQPSTESPSVLKATTTCTSGGPFSHLTNGSMQYRNTPEQAISCADREGNGKCEPRVETRCAAQREQAYRSPVSGEATCRSFHPQLYLLGLNEPHPRNWNLHDASPRSEAYLDASIKARERDCSKEACGDCQRFHTRKLAIHRFQGAVGRVGLQLRANRKHVPSRSCRSVKHSDMERTSLSQVPPSYSIATARMGNKWRTDAGVRGLTRPPWTVTQDTLTPSQAWLYRVTASLYARTRPGGGRSVIV